MDYVKPTAVVTAMVDAGTAKLALAPRDLVIRGAMAGGLLASATALALTGAMQTGIPLVGAIIFPVSLVIIVLLGLELLTGSFALLPLGAMENNVPVERVVANFAWVFLGNLIGSVAFGCLLTVALTGAGTTAPTGIAKSIVALAEAKTNGYAAMGFAGMITVFVKAILCNWLVSLGVVMGMTSTSTVGKVCAVWLPIFMFFAQSFEHSIVNMFLIPTGMLLGANVSFFDWWFWNQIPVTLGNFVAGFLLTGMALYSTYRPTVPAAIPASMKTPAE
jgi:formate/nitrite transporter